MPFALELARLINATTFDSLPADTLHWAKVGILDTVGVTIAGAADTSARICARSLGSASGPAYVFGSAEKVGMLDAALINGTASHALDFDDCNNTLGGHPSAPIIPALFALADEIGAGGRDFVAAYVAGFEAECKISMGVNFYQYTRGWHPTTTIGVFGAAAACAHLLKLSDEQTATVLSIAASLAAGVKSNFGTMTKPLHVGHCNRSGLFAALLARDGFTASAVAFEHNQGYFEVFNGAGNYDAAKILPAWGKPWDIIEPGIAIKQYPCCGSTHPAIDAMLMLVREHDLKPDDVTRIDSWTHKRRLEHTNRPDPLSTFDAKFSVQYCVLRALLDGKVVMEHFENDAYREPLVRELLPRVEAIPLKGIAFDKEDPFNALVRVTLSDGRVLESAVDFPLGRTSANPIAFEDLKAKFENCAGRVLPAPTAQALASSIDAMDRLAHVRDLMKQVVSAAPVLIRRSA